jgi:hypothetical protein
MATAAENVVPIRDFVLLPREVPTVVLELLRELLERAENGEITAFAYVAIDPGSNLTCNWAYHGTQDHGFAMTGGVTRLLYRMNKAQD